MSNHNFIIQYILIGIGVLLLTTNPVLSVVFISGAMLLISAVRRQGSESILWAIAEFSFLAVLLIHTLLEVVNGSWYEDPIVIIITMVFLGFYIRFLFSGKFLVRIPVKKTNTQPDHTSDRSYDRYDEIEKLHALKKKGVITAKEYDEKKRKLLNI